MITLRVDLNALRGNTLIRYLDLMEALMAPRDDVQVGALVRILDEEEDSYIAEVIESDGMRLKLAVNLESWTPAAVLHVDTPAGAEHVQYASVESDDTAVPNLGTAYARVA